jgi:hypothetical protein
LLFGEFRFSVSEQRQGQESPDGDSEQQPGMAIRGSGFGVGLRHVHLRVVREGVPMTSRIVSL